MRTQLGEGLVEEKKLDQTDRAGRGEGRWWLQQRTGVDTGDRRPGREGVQDAASGKSSLPAQLLVSIHSFIFGSVRS